MILFVLLASHGGMPTILNKEGGQYNFDKPQERSVQFSQILTWKSFNNKRVTKLILKHMNKTYKLNNYVLKRASYLKIIQKSKKTICRLKKINENHPTGKKKYHKIEIIDTIGNIKKMPQVIDFLFIFWLGK